MPSPDGDESSPGGLESGCSRCAVGGYSQSYPLMCLQYRSDLRPFVSQAGDNFGPHGNLSTGCGSNSTPGIRRRNTARRRDGSCKSRA
ncbi:hypothetical protein N136_00514 [Leifsonia aquatica ATCC 14665]|uniref:Uncharacterized protein n=1 Tax=Leifsonia aquatica ATCC 14665 TaxID=1358026 RepID=U2RX71_LEIAQ|nr:hypothetical protein N136_00514 [Leifsonia aquatica ATCC 14665]